MLAVREDRRHDATDLVIRQGRVGTEHRGVVTERGSEFHDNLHIENKGLIGVVLTGLQDSAPT